ncbi:MAG: hypothetical protein AAFO82_03890 [Bacteroidota bacterium]
MTKDVPTIQQQLINLLKNQQPLLKVTAENDKKFEVTGTIPTMQGKQKVEGHYFASVIPKAKDVRLYFFPIYTHVQHFEGTLSEDLQKFLKGKSCFHVKYLTPDLEAEIQQMIDKGISCYQEDGLL